MQVNKMTTSLSAVLQPVELPQGVVTKVLFLSREFQSTTMSVTEMIIVSEVKGPESSSVSDSDSESSIVVEDYGKRP